jgi:hypothetical protein
MAKVKLDEVIAEYRRIRDEKKEFLDKQAVVVADYDRKLNQITNALLDLMNKQGVDHITTKSGTAYRRTVSRLKVNDWDEAFSFLKEHELWHLLERRLSKTGVEEYVEAHQENFPGTAIDVEAVVQIRK